MPTPDLPREKGTGVEPGGRGPRWRRRATGEAATPVGNLGVLTESRRTEGGNSPETLSGLPNTPLG